MISHMNPPTVARKKNRQNRRPRNHLTHNGRFFLRFLPGFFTGFELSGDFLEVSDDKMQAPCDSFKCNPYTPIVLDAAPVRKVTDT